jgi:NTP pyrophosphatase (non-canonical NTP hydrolase)/ribosomal protein S17
MRIEKKVWPEFFQKILDGEKTFELRLADFECKPGDILVLQEWDPGTKEYTGRVLEKKVTYVLQTRNVKFWPKEEVERCGFQIIAWESKTIPLIQSRIKKFCEKHSLESPPEHRVLDLVSETGEVAKEILKMTEYGRKPLEFRKEIKSELGDAFYSLITVADYFDINLEEALKLAIEKYEGRLKKGSAGSEND